MDLDINIQSFLWEDVRALDAWRVFFERLLNPISVETGEISLALIDDAKMQILNSQYRHKNKPTNVLSFPSLAPKMCLGDVVLSFETIQNEATDQGKTFDDHVSHLFLHGILHLMGYDHETEKDRLEMELKEIEILKDLGIRDPYDS